MQSIRKTPGLYARGVLWNSLYFSKKIIYYIYQTALISTNSKDLRANSRRLLVRDGRRDASLDLAKLHYRETDVCGGHRARKDRRKAHF